VPKKKSSSASTKNIKARRSVTSNLSDDEYRHLQAGIITILKRSGISLKPSTYAKHAVLSFPRMSATLELLARIMADARAAGLEQVSIAAVENALAALQS
jgi:hypothetical protein